jgi:uncharacterized protein YmfQ (DUF2313 family)
MKKFICREVRMVAVLGALTLASPLAVNAESARSDNEQWNRGQAELQKNLAPGMDAAAYQKKLKELGYQVTATNYSNDDYLEYEVVKGDQTWEVQIDVDEDTRKATEVDIAMNVWKTDATEAALAHGDRMGRDTTDETRRPMVMRNNQYSDRDRASTDQLIREIEAMPVGQNKQFYKDTLRKRGFEITKVNNDDDNELDLEAVKNGNSVELDIDFDENTGRSTALDASTLWAEAESTTRTREAQETSIERRSQADIED